MTGVQTCALPILVVYVYTQGTYQGEVQAPRDHVKLRSSYVGELAPTGTFASLRHLRIIFRGRLDCQDVLKTGQPSGIKRRTHALSPVSLTPHHGCPTHIFGELLPQWLQERITRLQFPHNMTTGMSGPCFKQSPRILQTRPSSSVGITLKWESVAKALPEPAGMPHLID